MAALREDVANKVSITASQRFIDSYYLALNSSQREIAEFYLPTFAMPDGKIFPSIVYNGNVIPEPSAMQTLFRDQIPQAEYIVGDFDCHVINPNYVAEGTKGASAGSGKIMTILLTVSGSVKYGESRAVQPLGFSDTFVLAPNPATHKNTQPLKDWLIQSQISRLVS